MKTEEQIKEYFDKYKIKGSDVIKVINFLDGTEKKVKNTIYIQGGDKGCTFEHFLGWWNNGEVEVKHSPIPRLGKPMDKKEDFSRIATDYSDSLLMAMYFGTLDDIMSIVIKDILESKKTSKSIEEQIDDFVKRMRESAEPKRGDFCVFWDGKCKQEALCDVFYAKSPMGYLTKDGVVFDNCIKFTTIEDFKKLIGYAE